MGYVREARIPFTIAKLTDCNPWAWMRLGGDILNLRLLRSAMLAAFLAQVAAAQVRAEPNPFLPPGVEDAGWTHLRGPNYDGHSPEVNLADAWPDEGPPILWVRELGQGYSGFVAKRDRVFTQYQDLGGQYVVCLDAATGETVWQYRYDWPFEMSGMYPGPRATPTLAGERVYFASPGGEVGCLDENGSLLWSTNLTQTFDGQGTDFGCACAPTIVDGKAIVPVGGRGASIVTLDARDGSLVWKSGDDPSSYTPVMPITLAGRRQVIGYLQNALVGCDLETGEQLWRVELSHGYDEHSAWPIYHEPHLWISGPFHAGSRLLRLPEPPGRGCETVWDQRTMSNDVASSVLVDGFLYGFDLRDVQTKAHRPSRGSFRCLELLSGNERWANGDASARRDPQRDRAIGHAAAIVADGKLILLNDTGELILVRATPDRCNELARSAVLGGEIVWTAPALHRGCVYVRNHSRAVCVYVGRRELLEPRLASRATTVAAMRPAAYFNLAAVLGVEPEFAFDVPSAAWLRTWFAAGAALLGSAVLLAGAAIWPWRLRFKEAVTWPRVRTLWLAAAFVLGLAGTTALSMWRGEFVFTWPLALFVVYQVAVDHLRIGRRGEPRRVQWRSRFLLLVFVGVCAGYFLLCR